MTRDTLTDSFTSTFNTLTGTELVVNQELTKLHGTTLWDSALVLARVIERIIKTDPKYFKDKRVLEVGAGVGLPSMVLYTYRNQLGSLDLTVSDNNQSALEICMSNFERNFEQTPKFNYIDISQTENDDSYDIILVSDLLYDSNLYVPLVNTLKTAKRVILCYEKRDFGTEIQFFELLGKFFRFKHVAENSPFADPEYFSDDIYIFLCDRKEEE